MKSQTVKNMGPCIVFDGMAEEAAPSDWSSMDFIRWRALTFSISFLKCEKWKIRWMSLKRSYSEKSTKNDHVHKRLNMIHSNHFLTLDMLANTCTYKSLNKHHSLSVSMRDNLIFGNCVAYVACGAYKNNPYKICSPIRWEGLDRISVNNRNKKNLTEMHLITIDLTGIRVTFLCNITKDPQIVNGRYA